MSSFSYGLSFLLYISLATHVLATTCWQNADCIESQSSSFPGPWESNMYSPTSRTVSPVTILEANHQILSKYPGKASLHGNGSLLIFDFGLEVGGIVTITYTASGQGTLGLAFTEAKNFTGYQSDESSGGSGPDGALYTHIASQVPTNGTYTMPLEKLRGGFRYLSLFALSNNSTINVDVTAVELEISFQPTWTNLRAYGGYFHSSDQLLNRIWYACAYTVQTNTVPPNTGRVWPAPAEGWLNNATLGSGSSVIVDGAKRDRAVWSGDLGISIPSVLVSTGDLEAVQNALDVQYTNQESNTGELPEVGPPIDFFGSDTYHMATMIATHDYVLYSNDLAWLKSVWTGYQNAMTFITNKIDNTTGLLNVTGTSGWGRSATDAGYSTIGNMLLYGVLTSGSSLAQWLDDPSLTNEWESLAARLKSAVNSPDYNWDATVGAFKNTATDSSIHPEDGNSMALFFSGADSSHTSSISAQLTTNWGPIGAITPELPNNIVPYVESYEIKGHLAIRQTQRALDLMRLSWGWYLNNPYGSQSSMLEGYYSDGSFRYANDGYDDAGSYPSHSHGWSSGPVDALVSYVVGIRPTAPGGANWSLEPQFGDLTSAEGGFTTPLGKFSAGWKLIGEAGYALEYDVPSSTKGTVYLPSRSGRQPQISWNGGGGGKGANGKAETSFNQSTGLLEVSAPGGKVVLNVTY